MSQGNRKRELEISKDKGRMTQVENQKEDFDKNIGKVKINKNTLLNYKKKDINE